MAAPGTPNNFNVQTQNGKVLTSWNLAAGATSYIVQRSLDNISFSTIATVSGSPLATEYLDTSVSNGTAYWYKVASSNISGDSSYTISQSAVPTESGEMSLGAIRLASQQTADRINSNFVTMPEWNAFINLGMNELYDLLVTVFEDYYVATPIQFTTNGSDSVYPLPNGTLTFQNGFDLNATITAKPFYKLLGIDAQIQNANNGYVTINKYNFIDRNSFVYPNTASTIYGVFNMQYRVMGSNIQFIPTPSANQGIRVWYIPRLTGLLQDTDISDISVSGWIRYVIVRAAIYALAKEESDTSLLEKELAFLRTRIEESAANRDAGQPDKISDIRSVKGYWGSGGGWPNGSTGGF